MNDKRIGFWRKEVDKDETGPLPFPHLSALKATDMFLKKVGYIQSRMSRLDGRVKCYKGTSRCRLCGDRNGSREYVLNGYVWPSGYLHYLEKHDIEPDKGFVNFISKLYREYS